MKIYWIINKINGKKYIGQTIHSLEKRWQGHCWECNKKLHGMIISKAISKYGKDSFEIELLQECSSMDELNKMEQKWIKKVRTLAPHGYNLKEGGENGRLSDETKMKISKSNTGRKASPETIKKLSLSHLGHKHTEETKKKLSNFFKGKPQNPEHVIKRIKAMELVVAKTYCLKNPNGIFVTIYNMNKFCKENNLLPSKMNQVASGKVKSHKGWKKQ